MARAARSRIFSSSEIALALASPIRARTSLAARRKLELRPIWVVIAALVAAARAASIFAEMSARMASKLELAVSLAAVKLVLRADRIAKAAVVGPAGQRAAADCNSVAT